MAPGKLVARQEDERQRQRNKRQHDNLSANERQTSRRRRRFRAGVHQNNTQQSNGMEGVPANMRCQRQLQEKKTINRGLQEGDNGDSEVDEARRKRA